MTLTSYGLSVNVPNYAGVFNLSGTQSFSSGYANFASFAMPNITGGGLSIGFGKSASSYNFGKLVYNRIF